MCGLIGPAVSLHKKGPAVGETEIGIGNTTGWEIRGNSPKTTVARYFEIAGHAGQPVPPGTRAMIQFTTHYQHASGQMRLRVTTVARK